MQKLRRSSVLRSKPKARSRSWRNVVPSGNLTTGSGHTWSESSYHDSGTRKGPPVACAETATSSQIIARNNNGIDAASGIAPVAALLVAKYAATPLAAASA
ncbi:GD14805 [Drosophila simulans]|uniref:GD14805 n=1 Tax=Drosophila simulans TaxID=7240 RepID=B4QQT4_DROSI|nr:GD14805 [Drosophila simulans]